MLYFGKEQTDQHQNQTPSQVTSLLYLLKSILTLWICSYSKEISVIGT